MENPAIKVLKAAELQCLDSGSTDCNDEIAKVWCPVGVAVPVFGRHGL